MAFKTGIVKEEIIKTRQYDQEEQWKIQEIKFTNITFNFSWIMFRLLENDKKIGDFDTLDDARNCMLALHEKSKQ